MLQLWPDHPNASNSGWPLLCSFAGGQKAKRSMAAAIQIRLYASLRRQEIAHDDVVSFIALADGVQRVYECL
jgi:hypothetical protein